MEKALYSQSFHSLLLDLTHSALMDSRAKGQQWLRMGKMLAEKAFTVDKMVLLTTRETIPKSVLDPTRHVAVFSLASVVEKRRSGSAVQFVASISNRGHS